MGLQPLQPTALRFPEAETPQIQIESWSNAARLLHIRGFTADGIISFEHTTNSDRSRKSEIFTLSDWPIVLNVYPDTSPVRRGECYVRLSLLAAGSLVGRLSCGYLTDSKTISWPPGVFEGSEEGPGLIKMIVGSNPSAGSEVSVTVPTNVRWKLLCLKIVLHASSATADRYPRLIIDDGTNILWYSPAWSTAITAGQARALQWAIGGEHMDIDPLGAYHTFLPNIVLFQGYRFRTITTNLQTDDDYDAPVYYVEEWIEE